MGAPVASSASAIAVSLIRAMMPSPLHDRIQPGVAVPMHWGEQIGTRADAEAFAEKAPVEVLIMEPQRSAPS